MPEAYIVDAVRTPFTSVRGGLLSHLQPIDLLVPLTNALLDRSGIDPNAVNQMLIGTAFSEAEQGFDVARMTILHPHSGLPITTVGSVVSSFCTSSLNTIDYADSLIRTGKADIFFAGGVEMMSRIPMGGYNFAVHEDVSKHFPPNFFNMGVTAENLVEKYGITPQAQAEFAVQSHKKAFAAQQAGLFAGRIIPINGVSQDDCIRSDTSVEAILKLSPAFKVVGGSVNAGNSSPTSDGASLVMLASERAVKEFGLTPLMRVVSSGEVGVSPEIMGVGPVPAAKQALKNAGLTMNDMDHIEINEAFAAQILAVQAQGLLQGISFESDKLNRFGGALAYSHPLGASGARVGGVQIIEVFNKFGGKYGMGGACAALGDGKVIIFENLQPQPKLHI